MNNMYNKEIEKININIDILKLTLIEWRDKMMAYFIVGFAFGIAMYQSLDKLNYITGFLAFFFVLSVIFVSKSAKHYNEVGYKLRREYNKKRKLLK